MGSEEKFGIIKQPSETCSIIDEIVKKLSNVLRETKGYDKVEDIEKLHSILWEVEYELNDVVGWRRNEGLMEDVRRANENIRKWGQEWKDLAKTMRGKLEEMGYKEESCV